MPIANPTGCQSTLDEQFQSYTLLSQPSIPICFTPATCDLDISGNTTTNVTIKGGSDGEIEAGVSGNTGTTIQWYIDGTLEMGSGVTHTFTGLTAGFYEITAIEGDCIALENDIQIVDGEFRTGTMGITQAADLCAAENPVIYELRTAVTGVGKKSILEIVVNSGTTSDGDKIEFDLTAPYQYNQTFYAKGFPNKSNYFLASVTTDDDGDNVGTNTRSEIAQSLADALQQDVLLPKVYTISYDGSNTITLTAKQAGERFTLNTTNVTSSSSNIVVAGVQTGVNAYDGQQVDNYSIYLEIFQNPNQTQYPSLGNEVDYVRIAEIELPFQSNNIHRFDVASILKNYVFSSRPNYSQTGYTVQPDMLKPYYIRYGEKYPIVINTNTKKKRYKDATDYKWVINSALDHYTANDMEAEGYLGDRFHDIKLDFSGTITTSGTTYASLNINDYLWNSGNTTGIQFRFTESVGSTDSGWQTGNTITYDSLSYYDGVVYISGVTDGVNVTYDKSWWAYPSAESSEIKSNTGEPEIINDVLFLTNQPNPKNIQRESQEYLAFILQSSYGAKLDVRGDLYFYDGSSVTGETFFEIQDATGNTAGGVLLLNISYDKLGLGTYETGGTTNRKIKRADFAVYQTDSEDNVFQYTEEKSYKFEIEDRPRKFGIVFQNILGGWDSFDAVGIVEETIERESGTYTVPINYNTDGSAAQGFKSKVSYNTKVTNKVTINSGWIDINHFNWLKELMQSNEIYSYTTDNQNYMVLEDFKYQKSSLDDLYEIEATFIMTIYDNNINV